MTELSHMVGRNGTEVPKAAKYPIDHKMFHHGAAVSGLAAIVTGIFMMLRVDTWLGAANPYLLDITDGTWGVVYVVHGVSGCGTVRSDHHAQLLRHTAGQVVDHEVDDLWVHRPRQIRGETSNPGRWVIPDATPQEELVPAGVGASTGGGGEESGATGESSVDSGPTGELERLEGREKSPPTMNGLQRSEVWTEVTVRRVEGTHRYD